jgi:hypothetical protein
MLHFNTPELEIPPTYGGQEVGQPIPFLFEIKGSREHIAVAITLYMAYKKRAPGIGSRRAALRKTHARSALTVNPVKLPSGVVQLDSSHNARRINRKRKYST